MPTTPSAPWALAKASDDLYTLLARSGLEEGVSRFAIRLALERAFAAGQRAGLLAPVLPNARCPSESLPTAPTGTSLRCERSVGHEPPHLAHVGATIEWLDHAPEQPASPPTRIEGVPDGWAVSDGPCRACGKGPVIYRVVTSADGAFEDENWRCTTCGAEGWVDGIDA